MMRTFNSEIPEGPVIDNVERLIAFLREWFVALFDKLASAAKHFEDRVDGIQTRIEWAFWLLVAVVLIHATIGAWRQGGKS